MSTPRTFVIGNRVLATILAMMGWLILVVCWLALAWNQYSVFQNLASLAIATLLSVAIVGAMWVLDLGWWLAATVLTTFGCLSFVLYWIAFAWSQHTLLQNSAALLLSVLVWLGAIVALWLAGGMHDGC